MDDPQQMYNRDREQLERSLDSLRRTIKSEFLAYKRDAGFYDLFFYCFLLFSFYALEFFFF
jgi:hypothetical protein